MCALYICLELNMEDIFTKSQTSYTYSLVAIFFFLLGEKRMGKLERLMWKDSNKVSE